MKVFHALALAAASLAIGGHALAEPAPATVTYKVNVDVSVLNDEAPGTTTYNDCLVLNPESLPGVLYLMGIGIPFGFDRWETSKDKQFLGMLAVTGGAVNLFARNGLSGKLLKDGHLVVAAYGDILGAPFGFDIPFKGHMSQKCVPETPPGGAVPAGVQKFRELIAKVTAK